MQDTEIIELYFKRDESAIAMTEKAYGKYCFSIAENILHNPQDSEECVSDALLRAWQSIPPQKPTRLKLFLAKIARNLAFDRYRMRHAEKRSGDEMAVVLDELEECIASSEDIEAEYEQKDLKEIINAFLRTLPVRERQIFLRRYFYAEPVKDIANMFGLNQNHVSVILKRTRKKLGEHLKEEGYFYET